MSDPTFPKTIVDRSTVGVFLPNSQVREPYRLSREYAREELLAFDMATWTNHAKDIRLRFTPELVIRGASCRITQHFLDNLVGGSFVARIIQEAWQSGRHALAEP